MTRLVLAAAVAGVLAAFVPAANAADPICGVTRMVVVYHLPLVRTDKGDVYVLERRVHDCPETGT